MFCLHTQQIDIIIYKYYYLSIVDNPQEQNHNIPPVVPPCPSPSLIQHLFSPLSLSLSHEVLFLGYNVLKVCLSRNG